MQFNSNLFRQDIQTKRIVERHIGIEAACKEIGTTKGTLSRMENSKNIPDVITLFKICHWLNTSPERYVLNEN